MTMAGILQRRRKPVSEEQCHRADCTAQAVIRVVNGKTTKTYCLEHFHRVIDVPPGSSTTWA
jgi:hypothetical protein